MVGRRDTELELLVEGGEEEWMEGLESLEMGLGEDKLAQPILLGRQSFHLGDHILLGLVLKSDLGWKVSDEPALGFSGVVECIFWNRRRSNSVKILGQC